MNEDTWKRSTHWLRRGNGFSVEIKHSQAVCEEADGDRGPNRWCVYVYLYPGHPRMTLYNPENHSLFQLITSLPGLHGGASYFWANYDHKGLTSVQIGADYNHLYDTVYTLHDADDMPWGVKHDAETLFAFLSAESDAGVVKEPEV